MTAAKAIYEAEKGNGMFGTGLQAKSGHYSLNCDWTQVVWNQGGSIFTKDKKFSGNDEAGIAGEIPAVPQRLGVGLGPPPVALEGFVALQQRDDLAFLAGRGDLVGRRRAEPHHAHHLVDAGAAGRARFLRRVLVDGEGVDFR